MIEKYEKIRMLTERTDGKVYLARDKVTGEFVKIKKTHVDVGNFQIYLISRLFISRSNYIVRLITVERVEKKGKPTVYFVFEHHNKDLKMFIATHRSGPDAGPLPPPLIKRFQYMLCKGVALCHSYMLLLGNLRPHNLLLDLKTETLKIGDLWLPRDAYDDDFVRIQYYDPDENVALWYRAPEVLLGATDYSTATDMWSVGCIFAEMVRKQTLFAAGTGLELLLNIFRLLGTPTEEQWPGVRSLRNWHAYPQWKPLNMALAVPSLEPDGTDLLQKMLEYDPAKRISAKAAMNHPYFDSLDKSQL